MAPIGKRIWAIAEGWIPDHSHGPEPQMLSHETACVLNAGDSDAHVEITIYFADREPAGPYRIDVPARRTQPARFNDPTAPAPAPQPPDHPTTIRSDLPLLVPHPPLPPSQSHHAPPP